VLDAEFARKAEVLNDRLGVLDERSKVASTTLVFSLTPAIEGVLEAYERFSIGTSNLIAQFQEINTLGLGQLEARATSLRDKIKILEQTNASDWFGSLSTARQDLAAVETQITAIRDGVNTPPNATLTENLLGGTAGLTGANDNLMELTATLDGARKALDALAGGGSAAFEKVSKALDLNEQAAKLADSFNRSNKALIDSGQIQERTARAYLDVLTQTAEVQQQTTSTKALDEYVASLTDEYALAKVRLALGADEAKVQEALNQKRAEGVVISEDAEAVIRRTIAATSELNQRFAENEKAIAAAAKATEAAAAGRDSIPDEFADPFNHLILEALS
jgi:polyhydroxyalkanoate synthesis regulator phasin